jgi:energy-coupling factor transporter ATP-binding protein EcfA2
MLGYSIGAISFSWFLIDRIGYSLMTPQALLTYPGPNFSGKSQRLRQVVQPSAADAARGQGRPFGIRLGELASNFLSGLAPTVQEELRLHSPQHADALDTLRAKQAATVAKLWEAFGLGSHAHRNPFTLSGGEQAVVAALCNLMLAPQHLAIDCTLEQVNQAWRTPLLAAAAAGHFPLTQLHLADNRLAEYQSELAPLVGRLAQAPTVLDQPKPQGGAHYGLHPLDASVQIPGLRPAAALRVQGLRFSYLGHSRHLPPLLDIPSLVLQPGRIHRLAGGNGAGKTTFAKLLTGVLRPQSGNVWLGDHLWDTFRFPGQSIGYSFQNPDEQLFSTSVADEVLPLRRNEVAAVAQRRSALLHLFGLQDLAAEHPANLPFALRKRVALASALAPERQWYILDEPTIGQDDQSLNALAQILAQLTQAGKGVILITHAETLVRGLPTLAEFSLR